jgi:hypothetical protein
LLAVVAFGDPCAPVTFSVEPELSARFTVMISEVPVLPAGTTTMLHVPVPGRPNDAIVAVITSDVPPAVYAVPTVVEVRSIATSTIFFS